MRAGNQIDDQLFCVRITMFLVVFHGVVFVTTPEKIRCYHI